MTYNDSSIAKGIPYTYFMSRDLIYKWNSVKLVLVANHIISQATVSTVAAEKYKFDLYGLLKYEINLPEQQIYPHMIVNGYTSSWDYYGERLRFDIIDGDILNKYYRLFIKK